MDGIRYKLCWKFSLRFKHQQVTQTQYKAIRVDPLGLKQLN